jgi:hypothetical protein
MEMSMMESGSMTKPMGREPILIPTVQFTWESGRRTNNMVLALSIGPITHGMKVNMKMAKSMVTEYSTGQTTPYTRESLVITILKARENTCGQMDANSMDSGRKIKCMATEYLHGQTDETTSVSIQTTRRKAMANSRGQTLVATRANGRTESKKD